MNINKKILVGFTSDSSRPMPRFFLFRHAVIVTDGILIQVASNGVRLFRCGKKEIRKLELAGWVFIEAKASKSRCKKNIGLLTCVGFAKRALGINNIFIQTPDQLFELLTRPVL